MSNYRDMIKIHWKDGTKEEEIEEILSSILSLLNGFNFRLKCVEKVEIIDEFEDFDEGLSVTCRK